MGRSVPWTVRCCGSSPPRTRVPTRRRWLRGVRDLMSAQGVAGAELDALLVGTGPGRSRVCARVLPAARWLGFAWDLPVHGLCSLDAVAHRVAPTVRSAGHPEFLVAIDARRKELYWRRLPPWTTTPAP
ncbi:hypothetical protein QJS66_20820 [Kocuria rhizophila]|nr:hypothetical protein QJS66_20820 [Kocuria rhizophila]